MSKKAIALILSVNFGNGHITIAKNLEKRFSLTHTVFHYSSSDKRTEKLYRLLVKSGIYDILFTLANTFFWINQTAGILAEYKKIKKIIEAHEPDLVIVTHPRFSRAVGAVKKRTQRTFHIKTIITDYGYQPSFLNGIITDSYAVFDEPTKHIVDARKPHIPCEIIPNEAATIFHELHNHKTNYDEVAHLIPRPSADKKVLLIIGGSGWSIKARHLIKKLLDSHKYEVIVSAGKDRRWRNALHSMGATVIEFLPQSDLATLMNFVDLSVLASCGSSTINEVRTLGKYPLFVHRQLGGQERQNVKWICENNYGYYEPNVQKMINLIENYLTKN